MQHESNQIQKQIQKQIKAGTLPLALELFSKLPDSAYVRITVVQGLFACSSATVWRNVKAGRIPQPRKFSPRVTAWNVGQLRAALGA